MARVHLFRDSNGVTYASFECPGCSENHGPVVDRPPGSAGPTWGWNGDVTWPTFTPSILVRGTRRITDDEAARIVSGESLTPEPRICHSFVTDGRIRFLDDCTHALAGQTVDLPEFDSDR